ncbi:MAG: hypothetical protein AAB484_03250 [Patescibacteria group bacterium]
MFDKTFFKFALGFSAIILFAMGTLYFTGYFDQKAESNQTATVR